MKIKSTPSLDRAAKLQRAKSMTKKALKAQYASQRAGQATDCDTRTKVYRNDRCFNKSQRNKAKAELRKWTY